MENLVHRWGSRIRISLAYRRLCRFRIDVPPPWCCCESARCQSYQSCILHCYGPGEFIAPLLLLVFKLFLGENTCSFSTKLKFVYLDMQIIYSRFDWLTEIFYLVIGMLYVFTFLITWFGIYDCGLWNCYVSRLRTFVVWAASARGMLWLACCYWVSNWVSMSPLGEHSI